MKEEKKCTTSSHAGYRPPLDTPKFSLSLMSYLELSTPRITTAMSLCTAIVPSGDILPRSVTILNMLDVWPLSLCARCYGRVWILYILPTSPVGFLSDIISCLRIQESTPPHPAVVMEKTKLTKQYSESILNPFRTTCLLLSPSYVDARTPCIVSRSSPSFSPPISNGLLGCKIYLNERIQWSASVLA